MKKLAVAGAVTLAFAAPSTFAQTTAPGTPGASPGSTAAAEPVKAPDSPHTFTGNLTITSDYRFRGISQTFGGSNFWAPAIQGGIDYSHASGFYVGNWNSNVSGVQFPNGSSIEVDFYGGWKKTWGDWGLDVGTIYFYYPNQAKFVGVNSSGNAYSTTINNWEIYIGGSWKFLALKYYYSFTDYFGLSSNVASAYFEKGSSTSTLQTASGSTGDTKGTQYLVGSASYEVLPKLTLVGSLGYTWIPNYGSQLNYLDYRVGAVYDWNSWLLGAAIVGTNAKNEWWYATNGDGKTRDLGAVNLVLSLGRTF